MKPSLDNFAPRLGGDLSPERQDGAADRLRHHLQRDALGARAARRQRLPGHDRVELPRTPTSSRFYSTLAQGIPLIVAARTRAAGRVPLDRSGRRIHAGNRQRRPRLRPDLERRVRAPPAVRHRRSTSPTSAPRAPAATPRSTSTRRRCSAPATQGRPFFSARTALIAINSWGQRLKTDYHSLQVALNKPFTHGLLFKGAYTLSKSMNESDNDGRATLTWNTPSELGRNWAPAGFDRRHNFQLGFAYPLPWQSNGGYEQRRSRRSSTTGRSTACSPRSPARRSR